jgi:RHS repeat-associated protein
LTFHHGLLGYAYCPPNETWPCATKNTGTPWQHTIAIGGQTQALQEYQHDSLNRLVMASEYAGSNTFTLGCPDSGSVWCRQFAYDNAGNMTETVRSPSGSESWDATTINPSTNRVADAGWTYDNAGNVTKNPTAPPMTIGYDGENRQVAICQNMTNDPASCPDQAGTGRILYVYDGLGNRVQRIDPSGNATTYVYDAFGRLAAEYGGTSSGAAGTQYVTVDALGSTRLVMAGTQASERHDFQPYGYETYASGTWRTGVTGYGADTMRQKFTGQERDNESGLDFFQARYFAGAQGRFASPDPGNAGANPADPQSWNGYAYVSNNPLGYTDPSGLWMCATCAGAETGNPVGVAIGAAIDLGLALYGIFGGGGGSQADLSSVAYTPVTLRPSPSADWGGSNEQIPGSADSGGTYEPGSIWNERVPISGSGGLFNVGGVFGGGSTGPFVFSEVDANSVEMHHIFIQQLQPWFQAAGININKYLIALPMGVHRLTQFGGIHTGADNWNAAWKAWRAAHENATKDEMFNFA